MPDGVGHSIFRVHPVRPLATTLERPLIHSMLRDIIRRTEEIRARPSQSRTSRVVMLVTALGAFLIAFSFHLIVWSRGEPPDPAVSYAYRVLILLGAAAFWGTLVHAFRKREANPARSFWTSVLGAVLLLILGRITLSLGGGMAMVPFTDEPLGFELGTGVPLTLVTVIKMNVVSVLLIAFAFVLLLRLRDLVLFKRTTSSQRNWYLMLGFMSLASLATFGNIAGSGYGAIALVGIVGAISFMVINALRLSWIIFLSFRQKLAMAGLSLTLVVLLAIVGLTSNGTAPGLLVAGHGYLEHYSYALGTFVTLSLVFAILYGTTSFLSLLFHLPTTTDIQQKVGELAAMHSLTALVNQVFDADRLLEMIAASPVEAGSAHRAWLAVTDREAGLVRPRIASAVNATEAEIASWMDTTALYEDVNESRGLLLFDQAPADRRVHVRPGDGVGSLLVVPLVARDELLGALYATKPVAYGFEKDDVEAISVFAAQAALALDHARLFEEQVEKERMTRELDIARSVQRRLLPQKVPLLAGVRIAASSVPALEVGGDYYDFAHLDEDRVAFIVADVAGKGTSAAFYMAELQGIFQSVSRVSGSPSEFLIHANRALAPSLERHTFISAVYGILDVRNEEVTLARAGHCPPALIDIHGKTRLLRTNGMGLGLDRTDRFGALLAEESIKLAPGTVLVLYTDGVVETRGASGDEYGYGRLTEVLQKNRCEDVDELHQAIVSDLQRFSGDGDYGDDMTLMILKWQGVLSSAGGNERSVQRESVVQ